MNPTPPDLETLQQAFARQNQELEALGQALTTLAPAQGRGIAPEALEAIEAALDAMPFRASAPLFPQHGTRA